MPGFKTAPIHDEQHNDPLPKRAVYTYTWDVEEFVGRSLRGPSLIYLKSCTLPEYNLASEAVETGHGKYEFASQIEWADVSLTFYDTEGLAQRLDAWRTNTWSPDRGIRPADEYMATTVLRVHYHDGTPAYGWKLVNSWIQSIKWTELTYESSGLNQATVILKYSWAVLLGAPDMSPSSPPPPIAFA